MKYFATAVQGLGQILKQEVTKRVNQVCLFANEFDGRNDVVSFAARRLDPNQLRTSEDVYVEVAHVQEKRLPNLLAKMLRLESIEKALSTFALHAKPLRTRMSFRVVARVLSERNFKRSELRDGMIEGLQRLRPRWVLADPADLEFWILETKPGTFRLGLRLTDAMMRHRVGRQVERPGSLKPTVAAAMVFLAGEVGSRPLVDPACGSGTILSEAKAVGWQVVGSDLDPAAAAASRENLSSSSTVAADARCLPFPSGSLDAVVSNLPFGKQYRVQGPADRWMDAVLQEARRTCAAEAAVVLLVPAIKPFLSAFENQELKLLKRWNLRVRGEPTALWELRTCE